MNLLNARYAKNRFSLMHIPQYKFKNIFNKQ